MSKKQGFFKTIYTEVTADKNAAAVLALNLFFSVLLFAYTFYRFPALNPQVPLWYTNSWGDYQLAPSSSIFLIPIISISTVLASFFIVNSLTKEKNKEGVFTTLTLLTVSTTFLTIALARIVHKASSPYQQLVPSSAVELIPLFIFSILFCAALVPPTIKLAKKFGLVTDPAVHSHPGMILKGPSARAGGLPFFITFLVLGLIFVPPARPVFGLLIGGFLTTFLSIADDKKNLNPYFRLVMLPLIILVTLMLSNARILFFANPFDGIMRLDLWQYTFKIFETTFTFIPLADLFTVIWIMWVMNMLSWSNAVDGQYSGMTAISCLIIAALSLRLLKIDPAQIEIAKLAVVAGGAAIGILPFNWHPSKIMWGFGATTMGLVIAMLSIMAGTKVAAATLVLIVPTLDAIITIVRRLIQKKSPVWGDRGHFHHRLIDMGFSQQSVAIFYWILTIIFGAVALISSGREKILALLTISGIVAFILVAVNLKGELGKLKQQKAEK